jgi:hypothetical protein
LVSASRSPCCDEAIETLRKVTEMDPSFDLAHGI